jgi:Putative inner membrane protein (DUF1819)
MNLSKFQIQSPSPYPYHFGFTAGALGVAQCQTLSALRLKLGSWHTVRKETLAENRLFQARRTSLVRTEREFRQRVETLTDSQIAIMAESSVDVARLFALLAAFKRYAFLFDFCCLGLRPKVERHDFALRPSDYENFVAAVEPSHPEFTALSPSSRAKVRQVTLRILAEGGLLSETRKPTIVRPNLPQVFLRAVMEDEPSYLVGFLVLDAEIRKFVDTRSLSQATA